MRKNTFVRWVVVALSAVLVTGCGEDSASETDPPNDEASSPASPATAGDSAEETSTPATSGTETAVTVATLGSYSDMPTLTAQEIGAFQDNGLAVETVQLRGTQAAIAATVSGDVQVLHTNPTTIAAASASEVPLSILCGGNATYTQQIVGLEDSDVPTVGEAGSWEEAAPEWVGKTIGVPTLGGSLELRTVAILEHAGIEASDVSFAAVGTGQAAVATLESGQVDLLFSFPFGNTLLGDNTEVKFDFAEDGTPFLGEEVTSVFAAPTPWVEEHPDAADAFCESISAANDYLQDSANADETFALIQENFDVPDSGKDAALASVSVFDTNLDCGLLQETLQSAQDAGTLNEGAPTTCEELAMSA